MGNLGSNSLGNYVSYAGVKENYKSFLKKFLALKDPKKYDEAEESISCGHSKTHSSYQKNFQTHQFEDLIMN